MLSKIQEPSELKKLTKSELKELASELRERIVQAVANNGGHLASNLGIVELTIAIHRVFDCPQDKIIYDVGHQCYAHKLLTGRYDRFDSLRCRDGLSGFPNPDESPYDTFPAGHASTAISAALGMARARDVMHGDHRVVAVVGDGALSGGMCYEALNDAGQSKTPLIVILNDNEMSISHNVGAISSYLSSLRQSTTYRGIKRGIRRGLEKIPMIGSPMFRFIEKLRDAIKSLFIDGRFFETLGFVYIGPINGHDIKHMERVLRRAKKDTRPVLIHVVTQKGKGYVPAEHHPDKYHGVAPFYVESGKSRSDENITSYGCVAARELIELAQSDIRICVISAAMLDGTGMALFQAACPDRVFDVGIAEEHAVTMAAGMASAGMKPYVAIYSSFLQRAYDQMLIDVCRNNLPVTFLIDRAGFVGADGATHQGLFDLSFLRTMPNLTIAVPRDGRDLKRLIDLSAELNGPMAIRYPRDSVDLGPGLASQHPVKPGEWELLSDGEDVMFFAVGPMVKLAMQTSIELMGKQLRCGVADARFIKPMDERLLLDKCKDVKLVVVLEENSVIGGLGEAVAHVLNAHGLNRRMLMIGAPDAFVPQGRISQQRSYCGMDVQDISSKVLAAFSEVGGTEDETLPRR